jgi:hypothetical protein
MLVQNEDYLAPFHGYALLGPVPCASSCLKNVCIPLLENHFVSHLPNHPAVDQGFPNIRLESSSDSQLTMLPAGWLE